jgi:hypothetical protein
LFVFILAAESAVSQDEDAVCTYKTWSWSVHEKRAVDRKVISKPRSELQDFEQDPLSRCTVCREDQEFVRVPGVPPFRVCKHYSKQVEAALISAIESGFVIKEALGYRVGKSKGPVDENGLRQQFSNHSFGTAIDINQKHNGLYSNCLKFSSKCRLLRGGSWQPNNPLAITKTSAIYKSLRAIGWSWAGELAGKQKDFMHFSLSGD